MKALYWMKDFWYIPVFILGAGVLLAFMMWRRESVSKILERIKTEFSAIDARRETRDIRIQLGAEQAKQHVIDKYAEKRKNLDEKSEARVKALENDPEALAAALERLTR
jgi:hypothetical protein